MHEKRALDVQNLHGHYGESHVLHGMTFHVNPGEVVTLLGRNGAGKTTTMRAVMGLLGKRSGSIRYADREIVKMEPHRIAALGIGYCPEERAIFSGLSVRENLLLPPAVAGTGMSLEEIYGLFPRLRERGSTQGTKLSGGEQQILAIARILRTGARLLLLDEPTEGLAPVIVDQIGDIIGMLKARGFTILLVEQNFHFASSVADRHYVVEGGRVIEEFHNSDIGANQKRLEAMLGV
ncbi:ABC transporter ATP-binding protein [Agrobacterium tumefaciens]|uniref:ABC transporter ATP-binding protein n=1 Tax=Agrobacterium fabrum TaxID=1176649 RepID=UPI0015739F34|nr:ABC transporter ATP-binding protein [Agrobacterium fabrum]NTE84559.1 ABC transporter ATP-binding protein [Agrobacterium tumefaciens]